MRRIKRALGESSALVTVSAGSIYAFFALLSGSALVSACSASEDCAAGSSCVSHEEGGFGGEQPETEGGASGSGASSPGNGGQGERGGAGGANGAGAQAGDGPTASGGAPASAGEAGSSGDGTGAGEGGAGAVACERHSDCSDGFFCSGLERCEAGRCVDGPSPCEGMASDGCDVACVESADECVLRASDHDGDGSPSAACAAEPGDDCNDAEASAYPGADETCDGLDNDCDGLTDLTDGLALSGQNTSLPGSARIDLAWSPALDGFGLALGSIFESEYSLKYATLSQDGRLGEPVRLLSGAALNTPRIAWNGEEFGILSREAACSSEDDTCRSSRAILEIAADGQPMRLSDFGTGSEYISDFGNIGGEWAFALVASGIVYVGRIDPVTSSMALSPPLNTVGSTALDAHLAFDATRPAAAWREGASLIHWAPLSQALEPTGSYQIPTAESGALAFGVTVEGYAFAWTTEGGIAFQRSSSGGQAACDPTFVPFGDPLSLGASVALSDSPKGTLVLAVDSGRSQLHLFRFGADCELIDETSVITEASAIVNPVIAVGEGAVALAWSATQDSAETAFYRVLSDDLCDGTRAQLR